jgi:co-chaperonin GroES (HSP10)
MWTEEIAAARHRVVVELEEQKKFTESGLYVVRDNRGRNYQPTEDFEIGVVRSLGAGGGWEPVEVGDRVMVRAISGGEAGADIGQSIGRGRGEVIVVEREEMVCKLEE